MREGHLWALSVGVRGAHDAHVHRGATVFSFAAEVAVCCHSTHEHNNDNNIKEENCARSTCGPSLKIGSDAHRPPPG